MCDCCKVEGRDSEFLCGKTGSLRSANLYKVYVGRVASIKLCRLCDIQLFRAGESRFLATNFKFAQHLFTSKAAQSDSLFD